MSTLAALNLPEPPPAPCPCEIYLSKAGVKSGPFSEAEFRRLEAEGGLAEYDHIWDSRKPVWQPLEHVPPPPPAPSLRKEPGPAPAPASTSRTLARAKPETAVQTSVDPSVLDRASVFCSDFRTHVTGTITRHWASGCEIKVREEFESAFFGEKGLLLLNLLDASTGNSVSVSAKVHSLKRKAGAWYLEVDWERPPGL